MTPIPAQTDNVRAVDARNDSAEYERGFQDALKGNTCLASSVAYVNGFRHGQRTALIGIANGHPPSRRRDD
jgi:hypothetical protein